MVTINILGHLQVFQQLLVGLQMLFHPNTGSTDWSDGGNFMGVGPVALLALTFALLHISTKGIWTQKVQVHHVPLMLAMYAALFVPTVSVNIHDLSTGQDAFVDNIPIGIAYPAAGISALATDAANQMGTAFQSVSATAPPMDFANGVATPLRQMLSLRHFYQQASNVYPSLTVGMARFIQQCAYPNAEQYPQLAIKNLQASPDLAKVLFDPNNLPATNAGFITMEVLAPPGVTVVNASKTPCTNGIGGQSCTESCNDAQTDLSTAYTNFFNGSVCAQAAAAATTKQDAPSLSDCVAAANGSLNSVVGSAGVPNGVTSTGVVTANMLTNAANFGSSYISQVYLNCLVSAGWQMGMNQGVGKNGDVSLPDSYCVITSNQQNQYNVENAASANMFVSNMTAMMSILQFLFYALAPLSAAVMLFAGAQGVGIFTKYLMFGLWTQSWFPVAAVLNNYGQMTASEMLTKYGIALSAGGTPSATTLLSGNNLPFVIEHVSKILANVDMMMALTPVITMIVFTGSYMAMSGLAQDINGEVQSRGALGEEAPSLAKQEGMAGVHVTGNPMAPGMMTYSSGAMSETMSAGNAVSLSTEAGQAAVASSTQQAGTAWSNVARTSAGVTLSNGHTLASSVMNSVGGSMDQSTAVGHMIKGMQSAGISADEQMAVIGGLSAVTKGAFQAAKDKGATDAQAAKEAEAAGKSFLGAMAGAIGGGAGKALEGLSLDIDTRMASTLSSKQGRDELWDAGHKITSSLKQASQNSYGKTHTSGDTAQLGKSVDNAEQATSGVQNAVAESETFKESANQIAQAGGNTQVNAVTLSQAYDSRFKGQAGQELKNDLMKLYGGDAARMQADIGEMRKFEPDPNVAMARVLIRGINGNTAGLSAENRYAAMSDTFGKFDGSQVHTGQNAQSFTDKTAQDYANTAGAVNQQTGTVQAQVKPAAKAARGAASAAQNRVHGGDPVTPPTGVSGNLSGTQAGTYGAAGQQGENSDLYKQGAKQVDALTGQVPTRQQAAAMVNRADENTKSVLMKPVEWANDHPELTAAGITAFNFLSGAISGAGGIAAVGAAAKKLIGGLKGGGGEPPTPGAPSGGAAGETARAPGEVPRAPGGPLPEGSPTSRLPGGSPGGPSLGAPTEAPPPGGGQWVDVLDKEGNVVGKTAVTAAEAKLPERALGEMLAARAAQFGGVALRIGGAALEVAGSAPVLGAQLALHSTEVAAGTLPGMDQRQQVVGQLMLNDPKFAQQGAELQYMANHGQGGTAEFQALQQQVNARIEQAMQDPASIPKAAPPSEGDMAVAPGV